MLSRFPVFMLSKENYFFILFLAVILVIRLFLYLRPTPGPTFGGIRIHHWVVGVLLLAVALLLLAVIPSVYSRITLTVFAVGLALFLDELTYLFIGGQTHADNYSRISLLGTAALVGLVFFLRKYLVMIFK